MKKIVILVGILFLLTGCSVDYHLSINEDLTIIEEVKIRENDEFYDIYYKNSKANALKSVLDNYTNNLDSNNYQYEIVKEDDPYVLIKKTYNNIDDYVKNSKLFNDYFEKINITKDDNIIKLETVGFNPNDPDNPERFYIDDAKIYIKNFYKVKKSNTIDIDKKTNTYYYEFKSDTDDFNIMMEYNINQKYNPNLNLYIMLGILIIAMVGIWIFVFINKKKKI